MVCILRDTDVMKASNFPLKRACSSVALLMVAVAAAAGPGGADSPLPGPRPPFRGPAGFVPEPGYDPCLFSPALSGCLSARKALQEKQQALAEERSITGLFRTLMKVKNEQSRRYIEALNDLNAVRERLAECEVTRRTPGSAFSRTAAPGDLTSSAGGTSRLAGDVRQVPDILLNDRIAYPDYVSQIRALRAENRLLRLSLTAKDGQLATGQKEVERLVAGTAELEARVKERDALSREDARQHGPLTDDDAGSDSNAAVEEVPPPASAEAGVPPGDYASGVAFSQEVLRAIDINSALGIRTDRKALIAGFSDKMNGAVKYSADALLAAMSEKQKEVASAREKTLAQQVQKGDSAVTRFQASPGVVKTPQGFLYRIERRGDAPLKKDVPLRLVVKESLADGTPLLDMVADGSELRQNVDDMPPIFKEVIGKMAVNGSATIMVPPELAYGEEGKPPHIPPGATLIYWFEIRGY